MRCDVCVAPENCAKIGRCLAIDETEAVARVRDELEHWDSPGYDDANTPVRVGDLRALLARLERVEGENKRLRDVCDDAATSLRLNHCADISCIASLDEVHSRLWNAARGTEG